MKVDFTINARQGDDCHPDGSVGIMISPLPKTMTEVHHLIDVLQHIARQMRQGADPQNDHEVP